MHKRTAFKLTNDNWHPSYELNSWVKGKEPPNMLVHVSFLPLHPTAPREKMLYRVSVWGNDDYGLEFDYDSPLMALDVFDEIMKLEYVDQEVLKTRFNFYPA